MVMKRIYLSHRTGWKNLTKIKNKVHNSRKLYKYKLKVCILFSRKKTFIFITFFEDIETPKVITPVVAPARSKIMQRSGMITKKENLHSIISLYFRGRINALCALSNNGTPSGLFAMWSFSKLCCMRPLFENVSYLSSSCQGFCSNICIKMENSSVYLTKIISYFFLKTIFNQHHIRFFDMQ